MGAGSVDLYFEQIAVAVLGGAGGAVGQTATTQLWERLRAKFTSDDKTAGVLEARNPADDEAVRHLELVLRRESEADPVFGDELLAWWRRHSQVQQYNTVRDSKGINSVNGTFMAPITLNFGSGPE
jgi:hypothetical protein